MRKKFTWKKIPQSSIRVEGEEIHFANTMQTHTKARAKPSVHEGPVAKLPGTTTRPQSCSRFLPAQPEREV